MSLPPTRPKYFLDLFAGVHSPLSVAAKELDLDRFAPFDIELDASHDILDDDAFHMLRRLAWSGLIGLACLAPPCKEFSRLKLRRGGPKALRTPEYMEGIPGLSPKNQKKVDDSAEIHARAREIFLAVCHKGGIGVFEQPPTAMSWLLDGMRHMSQEVEAHIAWVDACNHGMMLSKSWAFLSNSPEIQHIGCLCQHAERHESIAGKRNAEGVFISTLTAEYPSSLAQHIIRHMSYLVTRSGLGEIALPKLDESWSRPFHNPRHRPCDGAGLWSTADHTSPKQATQLRAVAEAWLAWAHQTDMPAR